MKHRIIRCAAWTTGLAALAMASAVSASIVGPSLSVAFINSGLVQNIGGGMNLIPSKTAGLPAVQSQNFNTSSAASGTLSSLVEDNLGTANTTTASITFASTGTVTNLNDPFGSHSSNETPNYDLFAGGLGNTSTTVGQVVSLTNIPTDLSGGFDLYIYGLTVTNGRGGTFAVSGATSGNGTQSIFNPNNASTFIQATSANSHLGNYLLFPDVVGSSVTITYTASGIGPATLNGIELSAVAPVPEPSLMGVMLLAALPLMRRRRATH